MIEYLQEMWQLATEGKAQGVWFWAAVYAFLVGAYSMVYQLRIRSWPWVEGQLVSASVDTFGSRPWAQTDQQYHAEALYRYEVSGQSFEGTRVSPWLILVSHNLRFLLTKQMSGIQRLAEDTAKVFYNPRKPKKSFLIAPGRVGLVITALICALPGLAFYLKFYS